MYFLSAKRFITSSYMVSTLKHDIEVTQVNKTDEKKNEIFCNSLKYFKISKRSQRV